MAPPLYRYEIKGFAVREQLFDHPFDGIRIAMGTGIYGVFELDLPEPKETVQALIDDADGKVPELLKGELGHSDHYHMRTYDTELAFVGGDRARLAALEAATASAEDSDDPPDLELVLTRCGFIPVSHDVLRLRSIDGLVGCEPIEEPAEFIDAELWMYQGIGRITRRWDCFDEEAQRSVDVTQEFEGPVRLKSPLEPPDLLKLLAKPRALARLQGQLVEPTEHCSVQFKVKSTGDPTGIRELRQVLKSLPPNQAFDAASIARTLKAHGLASGSTKPLVLVKFESPIVVGLERHLIAPYASHYRRASPPAEPLQLEQERSIYRVKGRIAREQIFEKGNQRLVLSLQFDNRADLELEGAPDDLLTLPIPQQLERLSQLPLGTLTLSDELDVNSGAVSLEGVDPHHDSALQGITEEGPVYEVAQRLAQHGFKPAGPVTERVVRLDSIERSGRWERWVAHGFEGGK